MLGNYMGQRHPYPYTYPYPCFCFFIMRQGMRCSGCPSTWVCNSPVSASWVAGITGLCQQVQLDWMHGWGQRVTAVRVGAVMCAHSWLKSTSRAQPLQNLDIGNNVQFSGFINCNSLRSVPRLSNSFLHQAPITPLWVTRSEESTWDGMAADSNVSRHRGGSHAEHSVRDSAEWRASSSSD